MNRKNFEKLAAKLETVPDDAENFNMIVYFSGDDLGYEGSAPPCGTCACAVGWGPAAGIPNREGNWNRYFLVNFMDITPSTVRADIDDHPGAREVFRWCFDEDWSRIDNTARGAAARIRHMLAGKPIDLSLSTEHYS